MGQFLHVLRFTDQALRRGSHSQNFLEGRLHGSPDGSLPGGDQTVIEGSGQAAIVISEALTNTIFLLEEFSTVSTANHKHLHQFPVSLQLPGSGEGERGGDRRRGRGKGGPGSPYLMVCCQLPRRTG